jgi:hypothetical protein
MLYEQPYITSLTTSPATSRVAPSVLRNRLYFLPQEGCSGVRFPLTDFCILATFEQSRGTRERVDGVQLSKGLEVGAAGAGPLALR